MPSEPTRTASGNGPYEGNHNSYTSTNDCAIIIGFIMRVIGSKDPRDTAGALLAAYIDLCSRCQLPTPTVEEIADQAHDCILESKQENVN
jgi:hypothetical protein